VIVRIIGKIDGLRQCEAPRNDIYILSVF